MIPTQLRWLLPIPLQPPSPRHSRCSTQGRRTDQRTHMFTRDAETRHHEHATPQGDSTAPHPASASPTSWCKACLMHVGREARQSQGTSPSCSRKRATDPLSEGDSLLWLSAREDCACKARLTASTPCKASSDAKPTVTPESGSPRTTRPLTRGLKPAQFAAIARDRQGSPLLALKAA